MPESEAEKEERAGRKRKRSDSDTSVSSRPPSARGSDDEKPESKPIVKGTAGQAATEVANQAASQEVDVPPMTKKANVKDHCKYYSTGGECGKKGKCRFVHDPEVRSRALAERQANGGRMTLEHALKVHDSDRDNGGVLVSIKHLEEVGKIRKELIPSDDIKPEPPADVATPGQQNEGHHDPGHQNSSQSGDPASGSKAYSTHLPVPPTHHDLPVKPPGPKTENHQVAYGYYQVPRSGHQVPAHGPQVAQASQVAHGSQPAQGRQATQAAQAARSPSPEPESSPEPLYATLKGFGNPEEHC